MKSSLPLPLLALALSSFAIGTTEFVIMGLLPEVAADLGVSIPSAGWLVSGYALGVAVGAPIMAVATSRLRRKTAMIALMGIFILGNMLCALAGDYALLMAARIVTAFCHGAFFGIGAVIASDLAPPHRKASAVALLGTGLTIANILGVPLGTALGQAAGWRSTFWAVTGIGVVALAGIIRLLPAGRDEEKADLRSEVAALRDGDIWAALGMTVLFSASMFTLFTYIAPILGEVTGVSPRGVTWTLVLMGCGLTLGNVIGGRLADWKLGPSLAGTFVATAAIAALFSWTSRSAVAAEVTLFFWAAISFAAAPALQFNVLTIGKEAPNLASTLNIGAFNVGNAIGAWIGGLVIDRGLGLSSVPLASAGVALAAFSATVLSFATRQRQPGGIEPAPAAIPLIVPHPEEGYPDAQAC
jgi:DHA1 family inner membrane transport protein